MIRTDFLTVGLALGCLLASSGASRAANPLEEHVQKPDSSYSWKRIDQKPVPPGTVFHLAMASQTWRGIPWNHHVQVLRPEQVRNPGMAFLYITGDGEGGRDLQMAAVLARRAGAVVAVVTEVPNQPLFGGRFEDSLIAYTLDQYLRTGDETWPLLFPMVNSAVRAMDTVQAFAREEFNQPIEQFVVSGASKRGWTAWLTAAVDPRVKGVAPMVIDILNMKAQLRWAEKVYGRPSDQIRDYTELQLHRKLDEPAMQRLRSWIDPYEYRERYTMPKLLLLGTNDPYWTVDALHQYWDGLPEPKLVFQTPNAGHDLAGGEQAIQTLAAWFQMVADGQPLPKMDWNVQMSGSSARLTVSIDRTARRIRLWTADSTDRDFRDETWTSRDLEITLGSSIASATILKPERGYRAFLAEVELATPAGEPCKLSTEARVIPDEMRED